MLISLIQTFQCACLYTNIYQFIKMSYMYKELVKFNCIYTLIFFNKLSVDSFSASLYLVLCYIKEYSQKIHTELPIYMKFQY